MVAHSQAHGSRSLFIPVREVIRETADACSIVLDVPNELVDKFAYKPGQFLTIRIPSDRPGSVARCYSLATSPFTDSAPKVTVKRTQGGYGSNWLCDSVSAGTMLEVLPPAGAFTPKTYDVELFLFAAGSGITPVISIAKAALDQGKRHIVILYANRSERDVIFAEELRELTTAHPDRITVIHWLETVQGRPSAAAIAGIVRGHSDRHAYMCGPKPFMDAVHTALVETGFDRRNVHAEVFTSLAGDPFADEVAVEATPEEEADAADVEVALDGENYVLKWPRKRTLVDIMLSAGIDVPYQCRSGECGSCACTLVEGTVEMDNVDILDPQDIADGYVLGCQAHPTSDYLAIEF